jgi:hypothetical protein
VRAIHTYIHTYIQHVCRYPELTARTYTHIYKYTHTCILHVYRYSEPSKKRVLGLLEVVDKVPDRFMAMEGLME